jgi:hypothetical protein
MIENEKTLSISMEPYGSVYDSEAPLLRILPNGLPVYEPPALWMDLEDTLKVRGMFLSQDVKFNTMVILDCMAGF